MNSATQSNFGRAGYWFAFLAAAAIPVSVAVSQSALALAFAALALGRRLRMPPVFWPVLAFFLLTLLSMLFSPDPHLGHPQIRKFYVWLMLPVVFSALRSMRQVRSLLWAWAGAGAASALWSFVEFYQRWSRARAAGEEFYTAYVGDRISGFMSHWMTFSGHMMILLLLATALLMWTRSRTLWLPVCIALAGVALVLAQTRGVWLGAFAGGFYLLAAWRPRLLAAVPVAALLAFMVAPKEIQQRAASIVQPGKSDSNQHRIVCWRTGWQMIRARPMLGVGPEHVAVEFERFVPADIERPLPSGYYNHLHSIYVHYAAERGIPALLALLTIFAVILVSFIRGLRRVPEDRHLRRAVLQGSIAVTIAVLVSGVTEVNLGDSEVLAMFLATSACGYVALQPEEQSIEL